MQKVLLSFVLAVGLFSCSKKNDTSSVVTPTPVTTIPAVYAKIYGASSITSDGTYLTIKTAGTPDRISCYWPITNSLFRAFSGITFGGETFKRAPGDIVAKTYTFKIPLTPKPSTNPTATPMGPIGFALDGVPLYNQYAAGGVPILDEKKGFDQYYGHPQAQGAYHYHVEPLYITSVKSSKSSLVGFLLDGYPVYGPEENSAVVTNAMLDSYHGHTTPTADFPSGTYHYHTTNTDPYINGSKFYGVAGTITQ
jgi:hypothetical protein